MAEAADRMAQPTRKLLASIEPRGSEEFLVTFVGPASTQKHATMHFTSRAECQQWLEWEAGNLQISVEWVSVSSATPPGTLRH